jgi:hypothetical protein
VSNPEPNSRIAHYVLPEEAQLGGCLGRYLSAPAANVLEAYCEAYTLPGAVVLDPFARTDAVARAAARTGRKAILAESNPLAAFIARASMLPVSGQDVKRAFAKLADGKVGKVSLAAHLDAFYTTPCPQCGGPAVATELLWDGRLDGPIAKRVVCVACHLGEGQPSASFPATPEDLEVARRVEARGSHFAALLDRLATGAEGEADLIAQMVDLYTPRAASVLFTLVQRIEESGEGPNVQMVLKLSLLESLCACSRLESDSASARRGDEIDFAVPDRYVERNPGGSSPAPV